MAPSWRSYAAGSEVDHFATFCREHLIQSEDRWEGKPLVLEPWQRRMMGEALAFDSDGWPTWRSVVIQAPRKNARRQQQLLRHESVATTHAYLHPTRDDLSNALARLEVVRSPSQSQAD
jgi:hypothetical protein